MRNNRRDFSKPLEPCVTVRAEDHHNDPERMIRRFRKMIKAAGLLEEMRERSYFKPPSERRREKKEQKQRLIDKVNRQREELLKPRDRYKKRRS